MCPSGNVIETGVDKLVNLIEQKKKISVDEAAKSLGLSKQLIEQWADFLEEEKIISIEYNFTTTFLCERKLSKKEAENKGKEYLDKRDNFIKKVDTTIMSIDRESEIIDKLKVEFKSVKGEIGEDVLHVKDQLDELRSYEDMKKSLDRDLQKNHDDFIAKLDEVSNKIEKEQKRYDDLKHEIDVEKTDLLKERDAARLIIQKEQQLQKQIGVFQKQIDMVRSKLKEDESAVELTEKHIDKLDKLAEQVKSDIEKKKQKINPIYEESKKYQKKIMDLQHDITKRVTKKREAILKEVKKGDVIQKGFDDFFKKVNNMSKLLDQIDSEKVVLKKELEEVILKAHSFNIMAKNSNVKGFAQELEKKFADIELKKKTFNDKLEKLKKMFS